MLPVGATKPRAVDLRIVAATHRDLAELAESGSFRHDLYARIKGFELELPPLRERREDLGLLVASILPRVAGERASRLRFRLRAARALFRYRWPFNVRDLFQALASAVALADGDEIEIEHLPKELRTADAASSQATPPATAYPEDKTQLIALLQEHDCNVSAVARARCRPRGRTCAGSWSASGSI